VIGRILRVAPLLLALALVLPAASGSKLVDQRFNHAQAQTKHFLATCTGGPAACADVSVRQGDVPDPVPAGDLITYKIVVQNHGPDTAPSVVLTDTLPPLTFFEDVSTNVDSPQPVCNESGQVITCDFGDVENTDLTGPPAPGPRVVTVHLHFNANAPRPYPQTITNRVEVTSQAVDSFNNNNTSDEITTVQSPGDLAITKTHPIVSTTLAAAAGVGATNVKLTSTQDMQVGKALQIDTGGAQQTVTITAVGSQGSGGGGVSFTPALTAAHASGTQVVEPGVEETEAPNSNFVYSLRLRNISRGATLTPAAAAPDNPITVTDTLPRGFAFVGTQPSDSSDSDLGGADPSTVDNRCSATTAGVLESSVVTCNPQVSIPGTGIGAVCHNEDGTSPTTCADSYTGVSGGGFYTIRLVVQPTAVSKVTLTNNAQVTKYGGDPTPGDDLASDDTKVACPQLGTKAEPALCVTKSDSQDPVPQGQVFSYTIGVTNERTGSEDAFTEKVAVTDNIPTGMTVQSTTLEGNGSCGAVSSGGVLNCTLTADANGDVIRPGVTRHITVNLIALQTGTFDNLACINVVRRPTCAIEETTIIGAADLAISKTGDPTAEVNSPYTYTITITNNGPAPVPHAQLQDSIPAGEDFVSSDVSASGTVCDLASSTNFHCDLGTLPPAPAAGSVVTVHVVVTPTAAGALCNTATIANDATTGAPVDFNLTNNSATFCVDSRSADLSITKSATPEPVGVGQPLTYTIVVTNGGPGIAAGVKMTDTLPSAVSSPRIDASRGTCTGTATITCDIGVMNPTEVVTITIQVTPVNPGTAKNTATVTSTSLDPALANNSASTTSTITAADVTISKSAGPDPVAIGVPLTYTLRVTNLGPNRATGVTLRDTLPSEVAVPTPTPSQGTCFGAPTITCVLGDLPPNFVATVTITVTPIVATQAMTNSASVSSAFDLNSANNSASVTTRVIEPRLEATPDVGPTGSVAFAVGTDFPANAPIQLVWKPGLGKKTVVSDANGSFRVPMLVFPRDIQGPRDMVATALQPEVPATAFLDTATVRHVLVVPSTAQPFQVKPQFPTTKLVERGG
jgi:uncharacterized repeat protein (TIGR01451 family)